MFVAETQIEKHHNTGPSVSAILSQDIDGSVQRTTHSLPSLRPSLRPSRPPPSVSCHPLRPCPPFMILLHPLHGSHSLYLEMSSYFVTILSSTVFIYSTHHFDKPFHLPQLPVSSTLAIPLPCVLALGWSSCRGKRDEHDGIDTGSGSSRHAIQASHVYRCKVAA